MSSSPNSEDANQPPSPKKLKTDNCATAGDVAPVEDNGAAVLDHGAAAPGDLEAAIYGRIMEAVKKDFVSKEEHGLLKEEHGLLKGRLDYLTQALGPSTKVALFEASIYEFAGKEIPPNFTSQADKIKYAVSFVCRSVLASFLDPGQVVAKFSWQGPRMSTIKLLLLNGLAGLVAFIDSQDEADLKTWNPHARNVVAHNGRYLDCVYSTPPKAVDGVAVAVAVDQAEPSFSAKKEEVKGNRKAYKDKALSGENIPSTVDQAVVQVVDALNRKSIVVAPTMKASIINELNKLIGKYR
jgi:hypothetical protein